MGNEAVTQELQEHEHVVSGGALTAPTGWPPRRWKQACAVWLSMLPVNIVSSWAIAMLPWWGTVALPARSLIVVSVMAPVMTFIMMPLSTRLLRPWLRRRAAWARSERALHAALDQLAGASGAGIGAGSASRAGHLVS